MGQRFLQNAKEKDKEIKGKKKEKFSDTETQRTDLFAIPRGENRQ